MAIQRKVGGTSSTVPPTLKNKYLQDQTEGLLLVADIISAMPHGRSKTYYKVDAIMDEKLLSLSGNLNLNNELDLYSKLVLLSDRLMIPEKYKLLGNRAVIGLGGKFSSGKSLFINSLPQCQVMNSKWAKNNHSHREVGCTPFYWLHFESLKCPP